MNGEAPKRHPGDAHDASAPGGGADAAAPERRSVIWFGSDRSDGVIALAGGRRVGVAQFGRPTGTPVIWCHGGLSSRIDAALVGGAAARDGIRLIALDRPGIGRSSLVAGDGLLRWPGIVAECADQLGVETFGVVGWSAGGPYALACAYLLPDRVSATATVAGMYPVTDSARRRELGLALDRRFIQLSQRSPRAARLVLQAMRVAPDEVLWRSTRRSGGPAERDALVPETRPTVLRIVREAFRRGTAGIVADYRTFGSDWGFSPDVVTAPVTAWQGEDDGLVPLEHGERLADELRAGTLMRVPNAGHFLHATHGEMIMSAIRTAAA
jgi:pimeloyl-ACP methyl ester carboxylesterase